MPKDRSKKREKTCEIEPKYHGTMVGIVLGDGTVSTSSDTEMNLNSIQGQNLHTAAG